MGIKGLWQLLLPTGRRISIETLAGKRLAVDASIWLTQFLKANRDPETGQVRANAHLIGFLRRVCKLLFHGIRPIFVFDGATPEIKLREIRERRKRRDRLHTFKSEDGNEGVKRLARRILVATLKKQKELEVAQDKMEDGKKVKNPMAVLRKANLKSTKKTGAFASGFALPGEEETDDGESGAEETYALDIVGNTIGDQANFKGSKEDDVLVLSDSEDYLKTLTQEQQNTNNDWDNAIAAAHSDSEKSEDSIQIPDGQPLDIEILTNLPSKTRVDVIEKARRQQRMLSRNEFMSVAANPDSYSQCQLKNFLKSASLNKTVSQLGKIAAKKGEDGLLGERIASDGTRRFIFEKDADDDNMIKENNSKKRGLDLVGGEDAVKHRKRLKNLGDKTQAIDEDSDNEIFDQQEKTVNHINLFDDESDSEGGGFVVPSQGVPQEKKHSQHITINSSDDSEDSAAGGFILEDKSDSEGGGFIDPAQGVPQEKKHSLHITINSSDDSEDSAAGGFILEDNMSDVGGFMPSNSISIRNDVAIGLSSNSLDKHNEFRGRDNGYGMNIECAEEVMEIGSSSDEDGKNNQRMERNESDENEMIEVGSTSDVSTSNVPVENTRVVAGRPLGVDDDEDASEASIDWEEGDVMSLEGGSGNPQMLMSGMMESKNEESKNSTTVAIPPVLGNNINAKNEDDSSDGIVWEDCSDDESTENGKRDKKTEITSNSFLTTANAAALLNAQATASHLTDWAGRAVERAIKAHLSEANADHKHRDHDSGHADSDGSIISDNVSISDDSVKYSNTHGQEIEVTEAVSHIMETSLAEHSVSHTEPSQREFIDTSLDALQKEDALLRGEENRRERDMDTVTDEMVEEVMQLLQLFGIPYLKAPAEAEAQAVELEKLGLVDGVVTEDSDAIVFGSKSVYRNIFDDKKYVEVYSSSDSESMGLRHNEKVALAMLLGGDYTEGVKGVGIVNGMEILKAFPVSSSIETGLKKFREWLDGFDLNDSIDDENPNITEFKRKHKSARSRWVCPKDFPSPTVLHAYSNPVVDSSKDSFTWTEIPDIVALRLFCLQKMGWEKSETDRAIVPVIDEMKKGVRQTRLDGFFMRSEDNIKFADIKSKRLRQVWNLKKNKDDPEES